MHATLSAFFYLCVYTYYINLWKSAVRILAEGKRGDGPGDSRQGLSRVELEKLDFVKMLKLHASSYCKATNTYCVDLMGTCLRGAWKYI